MPRVPDYGNLQVMPNIAPGARVRSMDPNAVAQSLRGIRNALEGAETANRAAASVALDFANAANGLRVKEAINKLRAEEQRLTYDKTDGYTTILGGNALNRGEKGSLDQEYNQKLKTYGDKVRMALGNDAQRRMFDESSAGIYTQFGSGLQKHMLKQFYAYGDSVREQEAEQIAQGMMFSDDPEVIASGVQGLHRIAEEHAQIYGTAEDVTRLTGPVLQRVIDTKISAGYLGTAKRMMEVFAPYLGAQQIAALKKSYQEESEYARADAAAKEAHRLAKEKGMEAAAAYLDRQPYNIKRNANAFFNGMVTRDKQIQEETDKRGTVNAIRLIEGGQHVTRSMLVGMTTEQQDKVLDYQRDFKEGKEIATDVPTYLRVMEMIDNGRVQTVEDYEQLVLPLYGNLGFTDRNRAQAAFNSNQKAGYTGGGSIRGGIVKDIFDEALKLSGRDASKFTVEERRSLYDAARFTVDQSYAETGKPPQDVTEAAFGLLQKGDSFFGRRYYQAFGEGNRGRFNINPDTLGSAKESLSEELPAWRGRDVDNLTARAWMASDPNSGLYGKDNQIRTIIEAVRLKLSAERGYVVRTDEATLFLRDCISEGESVSDISSWAQARNPSAKRLAEIQRVYDAQSF